MTTTFVHDVLPMFTPVDISSMNDRGLNLADYTTVKNNYQPIYDKLQSQEMPCADSGEDVWTPEMLGTLASWKADGFIEQ